MDSQSKTNAKAALNKLKMEIAADFGDASYFDADVEGSAHREELRNFAQSEYTSKEVDNMVIRKLDITQL